MKTYTIKETSKLSGLPESTLRYYETMGLIDFVKRDESSKHRVYSESDINIISAIGCLNITGMSIGKMKEYLQAFNPNSTDHKVQLHILKEQEKELEKEKKAINLRMKYVKLKMKYWEILHSGDKEGFDELMKEIQIVSEKLRFGDGK